MSSAAPQQPGPHRPVPELEVYARIGEDGFARLVRAFYQQIPADDILGPLYQQSIAASGESMEHAERRLRDFLIGRFGGPQRYIQQRGHPRLRIRNAPFAIPAGSAERWIAVMERALLEAQIPEDVAATLRPYFRQTAMFMVNR